MKVIQVINSLIGGGAERVTVDLAKAFARLGHESVIVVFESGGVFSDMNDGVTVIEVSKEKAVNTVRAMAADLVLLHMKTPHRIFADIYDENIFFVVHNTQSQRLQKHFISKFLLYRSRKKRLRKLYDDHKIVTVSKGVADDLINEICVKPQRIVTIYNPFDFDHIQKLSQEEIPFKKPFILNVAGLRKAKRQDTLLKAYVQLKSELDLVILGEGKLKKELESLSGRLGISDRVHFLGWQNNPYAWMAKAELFVLSSQFEGFGNVLVESLIVHTPVVSTNCPSGPAEILTGPLSAYLAKVNDPDDLCEKIQKALVDQISIDSSYYERFDNMKIAGHYLSLVTQESSS